ncbi:hypothetical protein [Vibrio owensii]|uniref:hypothetical protein n=1 Tax=Vibrio owensii TaxID=696485 RepID=UPI0003A3AFC0|nr:hypothetical protein [Vibrio owensii]
MKLSKLKALLGAIVILAGCGGEDGGTSNSVSEPDISAQFVQAALDISDDQAQRVDLSNGVYTEGGVPVLSSLEPVNNIDNVVCDLYDYDSTSLSFETFYDKPSSCTYSYTVSNQEGSTAQQLVQVNASNALPGVLPFLDPIAINKSLDEGVITVNPSSHVNVPSGFSLSNTLSVVGVDVSAASVVGDEIQFTPTTNGISTVHYSYEDTKNGYLVSGTLTLSIGVGTNQAPETIDHTYRGEVYLDNAVDLSQHISDADNDATQIVDVVTQKNIAVNISGAHEVTFYTELPGEYTIPYTVSDHNGGYNKGVLTVIAHSASKPIVKDGSTLILPPVLSSTASKNHADTNGGYTETGIGGPVDHNVATFSWDAAQAYCRSRGLDLPSSALLIDLYTIHGNLFTSHGWSTTKGIWTGDTTDHTAGVFDAQKGDINQRDRVDAAYAVCVEVGPPSSIRFKQDGPKRYNEIRYDGSLVVGVEAVYPNGSIVDVTDQTRWTNTKGTGVTEYRGGIIVSIGDAATGGSDEWTAEFEGLTLVTNVFVGDHSQAICEDGIIKHGLIKMTCPLKHADLKSPLPDSTSNSDEIIFTDYDGFVFMELTNNENLYETLAGFATMCNDRVASGDLPPPPDGYKWHAYPGSTQGDMIELCPLEWDYLDIIQLNIDKTYMIDGVKRGMWPDLRKFYNARGATNWQELWHVDALGTGRHASWTPWLHRWKQSEDVSILEIMMTGRTGPHVENIYYDFGRRIDADTFFDDSLPPDQSVSLPLICVAR